MFNNTSSVVRVTSGEQIGVILPQSDKVLNKQDIDKKIANVKSHIEHLNGQVAHRNTHGGKAFRAKNISLQDQISHANAQLELLQSAKAKIPEVKPTTALAPVSERTFLSRVLGFILK